MKTRYSWILGIVTNICIGSLIVNGIQKARYTDLIRTAETDAMEHATNQISAASSHMTDKPYFLAMLAEAGGTLVTLQQIVPLSQNTTKLELYNVGYYLHSQASSATSYNGLTNFLRTANQILQSHTVSGKYDIAWFASDVNRLNQAIPRS